jgi:hypothetical protein
MTRNFKYLLLSAMATMTAALYGANSAVIQLTETSFKDMLKSDELWLVEFYAPWCKYITMLYDNMISYIHIPL